MGKVIKSVRLLLSLLLVATFLYSAYKLLDYYVDTQKNTNLNEEMIEQSVSSITTSVPNNKDSESEIVEADETEPPMPVETSPISVDFDTLKEANDDVIGWLYCEDTPINYPVLQSDDNSYYLRSCGCIQRDIYKENFKLVDGTSVALLEASKKHLLSSNTSGHTGVYQNKENGKWVAQITFKRKTYYLGSYDKIDDAIKARQRGEEMHDAFLEWYYQQYGSVQKSE